MRTWVVDEPGPVATSNPLVEVERPIPIPGPGQVRMRVSTCGLCRTDLHLAEGDLAPHRHGVTPGHEVVGTVDALGAGSRRFQPGERIGIAWLASTCGTCRFCRGGSENLCVAPTFTGWDHDGGFAEHVVVDERFAYRLPDAFDDVTVAPLLCAGIIGYRALRRAELPSGGRLGIYGFGASAHLTAQVAMAAGATVHVMTRSPRAQELALRLGAASARGADGTLAVAGIHLSEIPALDYQRHLFEERTLRSVTANTRRDGEELLALAAEIDIEVTTTPYPFSRADVALADLAADRVDGAAVLQIADPA
ncbi:MAG: zinc-binding alcohol dehydrogenase family protein [Actinobacteria bacterium]|nr:zinc-binding alcohol dehydrogenase family protein [Actinomycetota bacterium]